MAFCPCAAWDANNFMSCSCYDAAWAAGCEAELTKPANLPCLLGALHSINPETTLNWGLKPRAGAEVTPHKAHHAYRVVEEMSFPLNHPDWGVRPDFAPSSNAPFTSRIILYWAGHSFCMCCLSLLCLPNLVQGHFVMAAAVSQPPTRPPELRSSIDQSYPRLDFS